MTIADLVSAPPVEQEPTRSLAHVEYQLRVLGLLCAAADDKPLRFSVRGSLESWAEYVAKQSARLGCAECLADATAVADSVRTPVVTDPVLSIREARNQVYHGGPVPPGIDGSILHRVLSDNAERIVRVHRHGHAGELAPYFRSDKDGFGALNSFSGSAATYWPRQGDVIHVTDAPVVRSLNTLDFERSDRLLDDFAFDLERDVKCFAERGSVDIVVPLSDPIVVHWERRSSDGPVPRVDRFVIDTADNGRKWLTEAGLLPYKAFLADVCNWSLLRKRLRAELDDQVEIEKRISQHLFPDLSQQVPHVPTMVQFDDVYLGPNHEDLTISAACAEVTRGVHSYNGSTHLITLTGEAGAGKTHSLLQFADETLTTGGDLDPVAIYISSSQSSASSLDKLITERVAGTRILDRDTVLALCRVGLAVLVIDGFDEMLGFRTYDDPLSGMRTILEGLRNRGVVILSARATYSEVRLRKSLSKESHHQLTTMKLQPWKRKQLDELTNHLSIDTIQEDPEVRQLLKTPFFCLAYAAWKQAGDSSEFLRFVVDTYLRREVRKFKDIPGGEPFTQDELAQIFCEIAELTARHVTAEVTEDDLATAAEIVRGRELDAPGRRRLGALCGLSAEQSEHEHSFRFTHLAIAEHFLARQVVRVPFQQAVALLSEVAISALCAKLITSMWLTDRGETPTALVSTLQELVRSAPSTDECRATMASLGELWANVHGTADSARSVSRIVVDRLELHGSGTVTLDQAEVKYLVVGPQVRLRLTDSRVDYLELPHGAGNPLLDDSYRQVSELYTQSRLATTPGQIRELLGLPEEPADESAIEAFFWEKITNARAAIVVDRKYNTPTEDVRMRWTREHDGNTWQEFAKRMVAEGRLLRELVNAAGTQKWVLRPTDPLTDR
ncbi:NACHT domain-containing protein [Kitasatospora sp. NPDC001664]